MIINGFSKMLKETVVGEETLQSLLQDQEGMDRMLDNNDH